MYICGSNIVLSLLVKVVCCLLVLVMIHVLDA